MAAQKGVTLIMVSGVLAILAAMGAGFYTLMISQSKSASRYSDAVRAELLMKAGFSYAVANLRQLAYEDTEHPQSPWYTVDYLHNAQRKSSFPAHKNPDGTIPSYSQTVGNSVAPKSDQFTLQVEDAAGKINLNACDNLAVLLDNLCRVIGPPLVAADTDMLQPYRWADEGANAGLYGKNAKDRKERLDIYFELDANNRPIPGKDGNAVYGDGYAIAGYRSRNGRFQNVEELKQALTFIDRDGDGKANLVQEQLELEVKFAALRPYVTVDSWVDTNTVCTGKFEWVSEQNINGAYYQVLIDRDKSWVADDIKNDPLNVRGSLRGSYVSIVNGHGAGQLRRIASNGIDWIAIRDSEKMTVAPGPISSYLIMAAEEAQLETPDGKAFTGFPEKLPPEGDAWLPKTNADGSFVPNTKINYKRHPLCIHRAPVNINTASDKVLAALFMGINVQHGIPLAVGTDADLVNLSKSWYTVNPGANAYLLSSYTNYNGLKRLPPDAGKLVFDRPMPVLIPSYAFDYLNNYGSLDPAGTKNINEAQELAYRVILARDKDPKLPYLDAVNLIPLAGPAKGNINAYERGPFRTWDDFYFRVVKPWDNKRTNNGLNTHKASIARMIMAHFNPNTDLLKFNPNIEWINRWGRNFTEMEPVMIYSNDPVAPGSTPLFMQDANIKSSKKFPASQGAFVTRNYRYKADELIDKSDLNRSTTEFSFDSNGIYEIRASGQVVVAGQVASERQCTGLVKVYDVWRETTQRQFVQGHFSKAAGAPGSINSGQLARDAFNTTERLALVSHPEPLVPLAATIKGNSTGKINPRNAEVVDASAGGGQKRNAFGKPVNINTPDVVANRVIPAAYDGQLALATNTSAYDPAGDKDTFLASFDGDLDTADCAGNGHEQAKYPHIDSGPLANKGHYVRVVDTTSLLGVMNDTLVANDPGLPPLGGGLNRLVYYFVTLNAALKGLSPDYYWNNVTLRQGALRTDGVYLSSPGVSGNTATLKYLFGDNKENFKPDSLDGNDITMWFKPTWDQGDFRTHEFLNASNPGTQQRWARGLYFFKNGQYFFAFTDFSAGAGHSANRYRTNDLGAFWEGDTPGVLDFDFGGYLYGGYDFVQHPAPPAPQESPGYRVQPFRWHFTGIRRNFYSQNIASSTPGGPTGHMRGNPPGSDATAPGNLSTIEHLIRPFIDTQLYPEGDKLWKPDLFWCFRSAAGVIKKDQPGQLGAKGPLTATGTTGQDVKWDWADPAGVNNGLKVFSINNLNYGGKPGDSLDNIYYHYRYMPDDGTYAVIDELKISSRDRVLVDSGAPDWKNDRVVREQTLSRYYLPLNPGDKNSAPTFTSQSLLQSTLDHTLKTSVEEVTVVRASWTAFTPRFMHEYKLAGGKFARTERIAPSQGAGARALKLPFKGPFDYEIYNDESAIDDPGNDESGRKKHQISVERPAPSEYALQTFDTLGVEVDLIDDAVGSSDTSGKTLGKTLVDPNALNQIGTPSTPVKVLTSNLRYRVRFKYPINNFVDPGGGPNVNPALHYMLDTPIFDDISVTYLIAPRIISFHLDNE